MAGVLHIVAAQLRPGFDPAGRDEALRRAHALRDAPGVVGVVVAASEQRIAVASWLADQAALEPFAASPEHMSFVMRGLAPVIEGMWTAAVDAQEEPEPPREASALWVFALGTAEPMFEWQVRDLLADIAGLPGEATVGPTIEERDRYRAGGAISLAWNEVGRFEIELARVRARTSAEIESASAPVVPPPEESS